MKQLFEISFGLIVISLTIAIFSYRRRRMPAPEALLASMHHLDFPNLLKIRAAILDRQVSMKELMKIRHNAACLVNLCRSFEGAGRDDLSYVLYRSLEINLCAVWAIAEEVLSIPFRTFPHFAPKFAASIYVEMWLRAKTLAYEYREDLIPLLEALA